MVTLINAAHKNTLQSLDAREVSTFLEPLIKTQPMAFLDIRTRQQHVHSHPIFSINAPFDCFEQKINQLFGRSRPLVILIGETRAEVQCASEYLATAGFPEPLHLPGNFKKWKECGLPVWDGEYTASKAFGEWVEVTGDINPISPGVVINNPAPLQIDVRPISEYQKFSIPGSVHCPTARLGSIVNYPDQVHVHCAGRTRGIIAAQTMKDLSTPCFVSFISGGTQGWELNGGRRIFDNTSNSPALIDPETEWCRAQDLINRHQLPILDDKSVVEWQIAHSDHQKIQVNDLDPATDQIAVTTLIQSTDQHLGTHHVPVLINGPNPIDVAIAVLWLRRMGWDALGYLGALSDKSPHQQAPCIQADSPGTHSRLLVDIRSSQAFATSRVIESEWIPRSQLHRIDSDVPYSVILDLTQSIEWTRDWLIRLGRPSTPIYVFDSIPSSQIDSSPVTFAEPPSDQPVFFPNRHHGDLRDAQSYLDWEHSLLPTLQAFGEIPWPPIDAPTHPQSHLKLFYKSVFRRMAK